jgi:hypothetical protein
MNFEYYEKIQAAEVEVRRAWIGLDHALAAQRADRTYFEGRLAAETETKVKAAALAVSRAKDRLWQAMAMPPREDDIRAKAALELS